MGWREIPVNEVSLDDVKQGEFQENTVRKDFTASELVAIKRYFEPEVKKQKPVGRPPKNSGNLPELMKGDVRDVVARYGGVSGRTLEKAEAIVEAAEKDPDTFSPLLESVDSNKTSISYAYSKVKQGERQQEPPPLPEGSYDVIYADPPWRYELNLRGTPQSHYATMNTQAIGELEIPTANDSVLFLWATNPKLEDAFKVIHSWGFTYKTNIAWIKDRFGTGYYCRGQHELLFISTKGKPGTPLPENRPPSIIHAKTGPHSKKPDTVYKLIETMYPNRKYLELFQTNPRDNWTGWGIPHEDK